jgi:hypothetical protein
MYGFSVRVVRTNPYLMQGHELSLITSHKLERARLSDCPPHADRQAKLKGEIALYALHEYFAKA